MTKYEKPSILVVQLDTIEDYLTIIAASASEDPQIYDVPTDYYD